MLPDVKLAQPRGGYPHAPKLEQYTRKGLESPNVGKKPIFYREKIQVYYSNSPNILALIGTLLYDLRQFNKLDIMPFIVGYVNVGKSNVAL